jgi:hypothetical protein
MKNLSGVWILFDAFIKNIRTQLTTLYILINLTEGIGMGVEKEKGRRGIP